MKATEKKVNISYIYDYLCKKIPNNKSELIFSNNIELLVSVMLSAQCTDKRVNIVTSNLFKKYKSALDYSNANLEVLQNDIHQVNYYKTKAKHIISAFKKIVEQYNGQVPNTFDELISLEGVGRKTANVVLANGFNKNVFAVDTHIFRVCNRLGLCNSKTVLDCEMQVIKLFDGYDFNDLHHRLLLFGRYYCKAIKPDCDNCDLKNLCKYRGGKNVFR